MGRTGQKVNPVGWRVGIYRKWKNSWIQNKVNYKDLLLSNINVSKLMRSFLRHGIKRRFLFFNYNLINNKNQLNMFCFFFTKKKTINKYVLKKKKMKKKQKKNFKQLIREYSGKKNISIIKQNKMKFFNIFNFYKNKTNSILFYSINNSNLINQNNVFLNIIKYNILKNLYFNSFNYILKNNYNLIYNKKIQKINNNIFKNYKKNIIMNNILKDVYINKKFNNYSMNKNIYNNFNLNLLKKNKIFINKTFDFFIINNKQQNNLKKYNTKKFNYIYFSYYVYTYLKFFDKFFYSWNYPLYTNNKLVNNFYIINFISKKESPKFSQKFLTFLTFLNFNINLEKRWSNLRKNNWLQHGSKLSTLMPYSLKKTYKSNIKNIKLKNYLQLYRLLFKYKYSKQPLQLLTNSISILTGYKNSIFFNSIVSFYKFSNKKYWDKKKIENLPLYRIPIYLKYNYDKYKDLSKLSNKFARRLQYRYSNIEFQTLFKLCMLTSFFKRPVFLARYIAFQVYSFPKKYRQLPLLKFIMTAFLSLSQRKELKGSRIQIQGRFDKWRRSKIIVKESGFITTRKKNFLIEYGSAHGFVKKGAFGIKIWISYSSKFSSFYNNCFKRYYLYSIRKNKQNKLKNLEYKKFKSIQFSKKNKKSLKWVNWSASNGFYKKFFVF